MTSDQLLFLGFNFDTLPSGRINISHKNRFIINGITAVTAHQSKWFRTLEAKSIDAACDYIQTVAFIN